MALSVSGLDDAVNAEPGTGVQPSRAALRTALRRAERRAYKVAVRGKLSRLEEEARLARMQRDHLLGRSAASAGTATGVPDPREQAVLAAHRLHVAACRAVGRDVHWASQALVAAGWRDQDSRDILCTEQRRATTGWQR